MIRFLLGLALVVALSVAADAQTRVRGYYRSNGTYVAPHYRSYSDGSFSNNWSTRGNYNPYTGQPGYRSYPSYRSYDYPSYSPSYRYGYRAPSYSYSYGYGDLD